MILPAMLQ